MGLPFDWHLRPRRFGSFGVAAPHVSVSRRGDVLWSALPSRSRPGWRLSVYLFVGVCVSVWLRVAFHQAVTVLCNALA